MQGLENKAHKRNTRIQIGKEKVKLSMFADDMILYTENLKDATKKLSELINELSEVVSYKLKIQKSVVPLYMDNKLSEKEIRGTTPFISASKRIKHLGINRSRR